MSLYLSGLALRCRVGNPYRKLLLVYLADIADDQGLTRPTSVSYLERGLEIGRTTVYKYRAEIGPRNPDDDPDDVRLDLITWNAEAGRAGGTEYRINVAALRQLADTSWSAEPETTVRETDGLPEQTVRETDGLPGDRSRDGRFTGETVRDADTNLSNVLTTDPGGNDEDAEALKAYAPDYRLHPAVVRYCDAFDYEVERLRVYHREIIAFEVGVNPANLAALDLALDDYRGRIDWNPGAIRNVLDRFKRYKNDEIQTAETTFGSDRPGNDGNNRELAERRQMQGNLSTNSRGNARRPSGESTGDYFARLGYE